MTRDASPGRLVALLCGAEILSMTVFSVYPALLPAVQEAWQLSNAQAGLLGGMFFGGYMAAVPMLTSLTDRVDPRRVFAFSTLLSAAGALGLSTLAHGLGTGILFQALIGAGVAGNYMPGLKILADRIGGPRQSRFVAFYTTGFGVGTSVSFVLAGQLAAYAGWRAAFAGAAAGPILGGLLVLLGTRRRAPALEPNARNDRLLDFRPVLGNRAAAAFILGYAGHCWELFGLRSWLVAFLAFSQTFATDDGRLPIGAATVAAGINLLSMPASLGGNELAMRRSRTGVITAFMLTSAALACVVGFSAMLPWFLVVTVLCVYTIAVMGDSSALIAGVVAAALPGRRGATMAVHSFMGFGAGLLAPLAMGTILDLAGGNRSLIAWGLGFAVLGAGSAFGALGVRVCVKHATRHTVAIDGDASGRH